MSNKYFLLALLLLVGLSTAQAQEKDDEVIEVEKLPEFDEITVKLPHILLFDFSYAMQLPAGHMRENFIFNFSLGGRVQLLTPSNWFFGIEGSHQFSEVIRTDVLAPLREQYGYLIDKNGYLSEIVYGQRGFFAGGMVGKLIPVLKNYKRSGIEVTLSGGYMQHWIRIADFEEEDLVQLSGDYKKGYDRMTSGFALQQFIGYRHIGKKRWLNVFAGFDFIQGFTQNRREWNFDTMEADNRKRVDLLFGFRVGLSLPIYMHSIESLDSEEVEFY